MEGDKEGSDEVCSFGQNTGNPKVRKLQELADQDEAADWELSSATPAEPSISPKLPSKKKIIKKGPSMKAATQVTTGVKELLLLDPP